MSSQQFDGELSEIYAAIAEQHRHENGPWLNMLHAAKSALEGKEGPVRILDLASGGGEPGLTIAKELPQVEVVLTDSSADQVAIAEKKAEGIKNASAKVVNACDLSCFDSNSFDIIVCCYGYMFFDEKEKAFEESHRVLKPGGTVIATHWSILPFYDVAKVVTRVMFPDGPTPSPSINPLSLQEPGLMTSYLQKAGFSPDSMSEKEFVYPFDLGNDRETVFKLGLILAYHRIKEVKDKGETSLLEQGKEAFWKHVSENPHFHTDEDGRVVIHDSKFVLTVARK